jgi:hypothetical protein
MPIEFYFTPELHLKDGRIIRDLDDAASFAREQEARPGVDQRDEVLHKIERAENREHAHSAAHSSWRCSNSSRAGRIARPQIAQIRSQRASQREDTRRGFARDRCSGTPYRCGGGAGLLETFLAAPHSRHRKPHVRHPS